MYKGTLFAIAEALAARFADPSAASPAADWTAESTQKVAGQARHAGTHDRNRQPSHRNDIVVAPRVWMQRTPRREG